MTARVSKQTDGDNLYNGASVAKTLKIQLRKSSSAARPSQGIQAMRLTRSVDNTTRK